MAFALSEFPHTFGFPRSFLRLRVVEKPKLLLRMSKIGPAFTICCYGKYTTSRNVINPHIGKQVSKICNARIMRKNSNALKFIFCLTHHLKKYFFASEV